MTDRRIRPAPPPAPRPAARPASRYEDPVDAVILAFLDHLEGLGPRPELTDLAETDRLRARQLIGGLVAARGLDPDATRASVESLLVATPLAGLIPALNPTGAAGADLTTIRRVLEGVDGRARVELDSSGAGVANVVYAYLDLRARFLLAAGGSAEVTGTVRALIEMLFDSDPDTGWVGVVAADSEELLTQVLSADDVGYTITTPRGEPHLRWDAPLPLALAVRRMLERGAPEWPAFHLEQARAQPLDVAAVAAAAARRVIEREAARSYRGDKRQAYQSLVGQERAFADLVARVRVPGHASTDLEMEIERLVLAAT